MNYKENYEKIVKGLIEKSFPKLKGKKIILEEKETLNYRAHAKYIFSGLKIIVSTQLRSFPDWKIKRILIHELCHLEIFLDWGIVRTNINWLIYLMSKKYRIKIERESNELMIKKGYGKLVLTALKENKKRGLNYSLSEKKIKDLMEKSICR